MGVQTSCEVVGNQSKCSYWTTDYERIFEIVKPGDIIEVRRKGYIHTGIYVGKKHITHLAIKGGVLVKILDGGPLIATVYRARLKDVAKGAKVRIRNRDGAAVRKKGYIEYTQQEIVRRCLAEVGKTYKYNIFSENCQEWCTRMRYGVGFSHSIDHVLSPGQECDVCNYAAPFQQ